MDIPELRLEDLDYSLVEATLESFHTNTLTPIIKEELKLKIQTKRLAAGKEELPRTVFKEPEKCELTEEEKERRDHRRERNRVAAAKCRNKRKNLQESLNTALAEAELKNHNLKRKIEELEAEKEYFIKRCKQDNADVAESVLQSFSSPSATTSEPVSCKQESYTTLTHTPIPEYSISNFDDESHETKIPPQQFTPDSASLPVFCPTFTQAVQPMASTSDLVTKYFLPQNTTFGDANQNLTYTGQPVNHYQSLPSTSSGIYETDYSISRRYSADTALHQRPVSGDLHRRLSEDVLHHLLYSANTQLQSLSNTQISESPCSTMLDECDLLTEVDFNTFVPVECPDIKSNFDAVSDQVEDKKTEEDSLVDVQHYLDLQGDEAKVPGGENYEDFGLTSPSLY